MSNRRLRGAGKLPRRSEPIDTAQCVLAAIERLPGAGKVSFRTPMPVRSSRPWIAVEPVCKDGVKIKVHGGGLHQEIFLKCKDPRMAIEVIEGAWATRHFQS